MGITAPTWFRRATLSPRVRKLRSSARPAGLQEHTSILRSSGTARRWIQCKLLILKALWRKRMRLEKMIKVSRDAADKTHVTTYISMGRIGGVSAPGADDKGRIA